MESFTIRQVLECTCQDCGHKWDTDAVRTILTGKIKLSSGCPRCGGTPKDIRRKSLKHPMNRVFVTDESPVSKKPGNILEADW